PQASRSRRMTHIPLTRNDTSVVPAQAETQFAYLKYYSDRTSDPGPRMRSRGMTRLSPIALSLKPLALGRPCHFFSGSSFFLSLPGMNGLHGLARIGPDVFHTTLN